MDPVAVVDFVLRFGLPVVIAGSLVCAVLLARELLAGARRGRDVEVSVRVPGGRIVTRRYAWNQTERDRILADVAGDLKRGLPG